MNKFTHIGKVLGEAVLTTPTADSKAGSWAVTRIRPRGVLERTAMQHNDFPDTAYTTTWSNGRGEVRFFTRPDGSRLRYYTAGTGRPLALLHTVRTQLDYFQRVIPRLWDHYTIYAVDLPGMGWSDIVPGAGHEEPELRAAVVEFVSGLNLQDVTLAGESLGAALALSASIDLKDRVRHVVAFNSYDYPSGLERGSWLARFIITSVRLPGLGLMPYGNSLT
jgi:pimeloyl-ACP methyl ester carboxylesterase